MEEKKENVIFEKTNKGIQNSFKCAFKGFMISFKEERNMKIHALIMTIVIIMGIFLKISMIEWIICIILFGIVIAGELFNTAIEKTVDIAMPYKNNEAKNAKDISAGAVFILAIASAIVGIIIFIPKILQLL